MRRIKIARLTITFDRPAGTVEMRKALWWQVVPIADLPRWLRLYRGFWSRKPDAKGRAPDLKTPGPWAAFYEDDLRALEAAVKEM